MKYTTLGKTGLNISHIGFGGIPIQKIDAEGTKKIAQALMEAGVNYIDTARGYTVSEEFIGYALESNRDKFVLATKSMSRTKEAMAADIEISLNNMRTDYIDLYQIHNPSMEQLKQVTSEGGALEALIEAKAAGKIGHIGFIAMKPLAGGAIEDATVAMRFICANPDVTVVIPGMCDVAEVEQNVAAGCDETPLSVEEQDKIETIRKELGSNFCRRCNYCQPCAAGINISSVFLFQGYYERYGLAEWAKGRYLAMPKTAKDCIECGVCETRCPYELPIRQMMKKAVEVLGE